MKKYYCDRDRLYETRQHHSEAAVYRAGEVDAALAAKDREIAELRADAERKAVALKNLIALVEGECRSIAEDDCNVLAAHDALRERP